MTPEAYEGFDIGPVNVEGSVVITSVSRRELIGQEGEYSISQGS
jgi:hypothetical protein